MINEVRGKRYPVPRLTRRLADVNPALRPSATGWPRFRRRNGVWSVTNRADADGARAARNVLAGSVGAGR
jgi:hypothetical protein